MGRHSQLPARVWIVYGSIRTRVGNPSEPDPEKTSTMHIYHAATPVDNWSEKTIMTRQGPALLCVYNHDNRHTISSPRS